jgi:hypothetical protein
LADVFIIREHREETDFILYFKYETILCVLCGLIKSLNLGLRKTPKRISSITNDRGKKNRLTSFLRMNIIIGGLDGELVEP